MTALPSRFDTIAAASFYAEAGGFRQDQDVTVDGKDVQRISTLAVQVLLALENTLLQQGHVLRVREPSPAFCDTLQLLGLADTLKRWCGR